MHPFPAHGGQRSLYRDGRIVYAHGGGPSNREAMQAYHKLLQSLAGELAGTRWGVLGRSDDDTLLTPDAEELMRDTAVRVTAAGRVAVAIVLPQSPVRHLIRAQWTRVFQHAGCALGFFDDQEVARVWLEARLAEADAASGSG
jgi:hypothetical protein